MISNNLDLYILLFKQHIVRNSFSFSGRGGLFTFLPLDGVFDLLQFLVDRYDSSIAIFNRVENLANITVQPKQKSDHDDETNASNQQLETIALSSAFLAFGRYFLFRSVILYGIHINRLHLGSYRCRNRSFRSSSFSIGNQIIKASAIRHCRNIFSAASAFSRRVGQIGTAPFTEHIY